MKKLIKPKIINNNEINLKVYTLKEKLILDWSNWNIVYIPEEIKPKQFKNKTLIISSFAKPRLNETFFDFMRRISKKNLAFILDESKIIHLHELQNSFHNQKKGKILNGTTKLYNNMS